MFLEPILGWALTVMLGKEKFIGNNVHVQMFLNNQIKVLLEDRSRTPMIK